MATLACLALVVAGFGLASDVQALGTTVSVKDFGARGDGSTDDTAAIQRGNDTLAGQGGGTLFFPSGTYMTNTILQDSDVGFAGEPGSTIKLRNGSSVTSMIMSRIRPTSGSIAKGSTALTVANATGFVPGAPVAIRVAGGPSPVQYSTLSVLMTSSSTSMSLKSVKGFSPNRNFVLVGNEMMQYGGISGSSMNKLVRGLAGTAQVAHSAGTTVAQLQFLYANVVSVAGNNVVLDTPAAFGEKNSTVYVGAVRPSLSNLTLDGNRPSGGATASNPLPVEYGLARWASVSGCTIRNGDHGGVMFNRGTSDSTIANNVFTNNGSPSAKLGSAIWLFQGAMRNTVDSNQIGGDSYSGIVVDNRTATSSEWDASSSGNTITRNTIQVPQIQWNTGIEVQDSSDNEISDNSISAPFYGILVATSSQGTKPPGANDNTITNNVLSGDYTGVFAGGNRNSFTQNRIYGATNPIIYHGSGNTYSGNTT